MSKIICMTFRTFVIRPHPTIKAPFPSASHHHAYSSQSVPEFTTHFPPFCMFSSLEGPFYIFFFLNSCQLLKTQIKCFSTEKSWHRHFILPILMAYFFIFLTCFSERRVKLSITKALLIQLWISKSKHNSWHIGGTQ